MTTKKALDEPYMSRKLRMKCPYCGHWNRVPVNKIFVEQH